MLSGNGTNIRHRIIGGQNTNVKLTSSNVSYDAVNEVFEFDVTIQNLLNEALGSINGIVPDTNGIKIFFHQHPTVTSGTGTITVANSDGVATFTGSNQAYYKYETILAKDAISAAKTWSFNVPSTATTFSFTVYVSTTTQALLVFNEVLVNPGGTITDANGEWFEIYNAGSLSIDMEGFLLADSAASGKRPYYRIPTSLIIAPGGYLVFGNTTNTTNNGGVPVDHAYGVAMSFANSLDAFKLSYSLTSDTLNAVTVDYARYSSPGISAQNGVSRELRHPSLDNLEIDGSNWGNASVTSVYGPGGRGTPKARNSNYTETP